MYTARRLERLLRRGEATVTVVDPRGYLTYQPFLAEAAGGSVEPRHVIASLSRVLRHTRVLTGKIVGIDQASRLAVFAPARGPQRALPYDVLVLAAGSVSRVAPVEGLAEYGAGFKTVGEAVHLRNHVLDQLAVAVSAGDPAIRAAALTFVVGGGFAGVEALAELQGLADGAVRFADTPLEGTHLEHLRPIARPRGGIAGWPSRGGAVVALGEFRYLQGELREQVVEARDSTQQIVGSIVEQGVRTGEFQTPYPHEAARIGSRPCFSGRGPCRPHGDPPYPVTALKRSSSRRPMIIFWISAVPSPMSSSGASR